MQNQTLTSVDFSFNPELTVTGVQKLLETNRLVRMNFEGCTKIGRDAIVLADLLKTDNTLQSLDLSNSAMNDLDVVALSEMLLVNRNIQKLNLYGNQFGNKVCWNFILSCNAHVCLRERLLWLMCSRKTTPFDR